MTQRRWLFGDQLGPHFLDAPDQQVLMIESRAVFARRRFHRQKAHLILSAMRHRAAELGERCRYVQADSYAEVIERTRDGISVCHPTSHPARDLVDRLDVEVLAARGFATSMADFAAWADGRGRRRLLMEDFYRDARRRHDVLMDGSDPAGGNWNFDKDNREPPPKRATLGVEKPWWPTEDEIDEEVRRDLDRWAAQGVEFLGQDGPRRFAATRREALHVLRDFVAHRLPGFGAHEDAILTADPWMAHSMLSAPMNLGLLDPLEVVHRAEQAYRDGAAPISSVEGFVRQVLGWRDYVWHLYWQQPREYRRRNALGATGDIPAWFAELDHEHVDAACLKDTLHNVARHGWVHHIPRLMLLGNYAMQRGWHPAQVTDWFHRAFVDGYDWVMVPNVVGMSQYADGGVMATKPYAGGGAYIDRMSDYCGGCRYDPKKRVGENACPFTAGYWAFLERNRDTLAGNHRLAQPLRGLDRLKDLDALVEQDTRAARRPRESDVVTRRWPLQSSPRRQAVGARRMSLRELPPSNPRPLDTAPHYERTCMETIGFDSHGTRCAATYLTAQTDELTTSRGRPCVVMGHGFGATRDAGLMPFAERFAAAGCDVLVFDYRGFGTSEGEPRQDVNHVRHRQDFHAAIAAARARKGVDPARIVIWGSSYSGGHVIVVAAQDQTVRAVISQGAAMDGLAALVGTQKSGGPGKSLAMTGAALKDLARAATRRPPVTLPIVGETGSNAVISAPRASTGYQAIMGPTFVNEMCARGVLRIALNRPVRFAAKVVCPTLIVIAEQDNIAPVKSVHAVVAKLADKAEVQSFDVGHFDIYVGEVFEKSVSAQVDFLRRTLL